MSAKALFYSLTYALGRLMADDGMSILCYHSIDDTGSRISLPVEDFSAHMRLLHDLGYRTMRLSEAVDRLSARKPFPKKTIAITFDDGFENVYEHAAPIMRAYGFVGTVFIIGGMVGKRIMWRDRDGWLPQLPLMDWRQIGELREMGFEIGAHSLSHRYLTQLPDNQLQNEVEGSRALLEDKLSSSVAVFSYPYGDYDDRVMKAVVDAGYRGACATIPTRLRVNDDLFALPRLFIARDTSSAVMRAYLTPGVAVSFRVLSMVREHTFSHKPWYVTDPLYTDSTGTVGAARSVSEEGARGS